MPPSGYAARNAPRAAWPFFAVAPGLMTLFLLASAALLAAGGAR